jgi:hypothetical protein
MWARKKRSRIGYLHGGALSLPAVQEALGALAPKHKFHAQPTECGGIRFPSKKEANYYGQLELAKKAGDLLFFLRQVPFHLPGGVRYVCDFLEFWKTGEVRFVDVKGFKTPGYIAKRKIVEATYPIKITEV